MKTNSKERDALCKILNKLNNRWMRFDDNAVFMEIREIAEKVLES